MSHTHFSNDQQEVPVIPSSHSIVSQLSAIIAPINSSIARISSHNSICLHKPAKVSISHSLADKPIVTPLICCYTPPQYRKIDPIPPQSMT